MSRPILGPRPLAILVAATRAIVADAEGFAGARDEVAGILATMVARMPSRRQWLLVVGLWTLEGLAVLLGGARFTRLDPVAGARVLSRLARSRLAPLRRIAGGVRTLAGFAYYGHEATHAAIGYDGPWVGRRADIERYPDPRLDRGRSAPA